MDGYRGFPFIHTTFIYGQVVKTDPDSPSRTFITMYQTTEYPKVYESSPLWAPHLTPKNIKHN
jgi:hypothetical protein